MSKTNHIKLVCAELSFVHQMNPTWAQYEDEFIDGNTFYFRENKRMAKAKEAA